MALPSSPPLVPEVELPTSPPALLEEPDELPTHPRELLRPGFGRKRQYSDYGSLSSDPVFSEGTSEAEEEVGVIRRRKRLVKGPWFLLRRASTQSWRKGMASRDGPRIADSGVWMGSDLSDTESIDSMRSSRRKIARMEIQAGSPPMTPPPTSQQPPTAEAIAMKTINNCLETGRETVDLSDLGLEHLSNATLRPLHQLIRHSHADLIEPPSEDEFSPLTPSIQLYLSGNKLSSLPSELFRVTNITVLSLRNNGLNELPPSIGTLANLKELNIAQNSIKWLPWEMLSLMQCRGDDRRITVRPNPLADPIPNFNGPSPLPRPSHTSSEFKEHLSRWGETNGAFFEQMKRWYHEENVEWTMRHEMELRLKLGRLRLNNYLNEASRSGVELQLGMEQLVYVANSAVTYLEIDGSPCRPPNSSSSISDDERFGAVFDPLLNKPMSSSDTSLPSLFELSLRKAQSTFMPSDLYDIAEDLPDTVSAGLRKVFSNLEYGNDTCSTCGSRFIIARAEWMEYWFNGYPKKVCLETETVMPFLRRVCSWKCAKPSDIGAFRL